MADQPRRAPQLNVSPKNKENQMKKKELKRCQEQSELHVQYVQFTIVCSRIWYACSFFYNTFFLHLNLILLSEGSICTKLFHRTDIALQRL